MLHNNFQTSRTILSGRIRVSVVVVIGGGGGGYGCKVIIVSNPTRLRLGWVLTILDNKLGLSCAKLSPKLCLLAFH